MLLSCLAISVEANGLVLGPARTSTPPTMDGDLSSTPDEWAAAASAAFTFPSGPNAIIYVMNDADNLYIALEIEDDGVAADNWDAVRFFFDNDNSGSPAVVGDDTIVRSAFVFADQYVSDLALNWQFDTSDGRSEDGSAGRAQHPSTYTWYFEFWHPLDSDDDAHDFSLSAGDIVGFNIDYRDYYDTSQSEYWWPASRTDLNNFGDIVIASAPVGGAIQAVDGLSLFTPYLAALIMAVGAAVLFLSRRR